MKVRKFRLGALLTLLAILAAAPALATFDDPIVVDVPADTPAPTETPAPTPVPTVNVQGEIAKKILAVNAPGKRLAASVYNSAWIDKNGRAHVVGDNEYGQCDTADWPKVTAVALGEHHAVGLTKDGQLVFSGSNAMGQCELDTEGVAVIAIAASPYATYALLQNGALRMAGVAEVRPDEFQDVLDGICVSASHSHVAVLRADGTVAAFGRNDRGACETGDWENIVMVSCGYDFTIALDNTGMVRVVGSGDYGQSELDGVTEADLVAAGPNTCFAVLKDGDIRGAGSDSKGQISPVDWKKPVAIAAGYRHTIAMDTNGKLYGTGENSRGQLDLK